MYVRKYTKAQVHQSPSVKARRRHAVTQDVALQYRELVVYIQSTLYGLRKINFFKHLSFHGAYTLGCLTCCLVGTLLISETDGFKFVDCLLLSVSAFCEAGLSTVSMLDISHKGFVVLVLLMFSGNAIMMLTYPLLARVYYLRKVLKNITAVDKSVLDEYRLWYQGTIVFLFVLVAYLTVSICVGIIILYVALQLNPREPEMEYRGFSLITIAGFHSLSAFANAGFAMSTTQMSYHRNNPLYYTTLSVLILLGNTASPNMLRWCMEGLHSFLHATRHRFPSIGKHINIHAVKYVLDNPRRITTNLFSQKESNFLGCVLVAINLIQYILYLVSTLNRKEALGDDDPLRLAAIGTFQTVSTRTAGFQIVDLRTVNQGMLVVYALAMYLSAAPFLSTMYLTEDNVDQVSQLTSIVSDSESSSDDDLEERFKAPVLKRSETKSIATNIKNNFMTKHVYYLLISVILLAFTEDRILSNRPEDVNLWYVLFEVASAYGTVGLSMGVPGKTYSLVGAFSPVGKIIISCVIFLGKHRGLPLPTDAVIDFKFSRLKRASRRRAKAAVNMKEQKKSMIQNVIDTVSSKVEALSPRTPKRAVQSKGIAILELKPREKRMSGIASGQSEKALALNQKRTVFVEEGNEDVEEARGSYHDVNPNLPLKRVGSYNEKTPSIQQQQNRRRRRSVADATSISPRNGTGFSPVDQLLSKLGVVSPRNGDADIHPFVYSPRSSKMKKVHPDLTIGVDDGGIDESRDVVESVDTEDNTTIGSRKRSMKADIPLLSIQMDPTNEPIMEEICEKKVISEKPLRMESYEVQVL